MFDYQEQFLAAYPGYNQPSFLILLTIIIWLAINLLTYGFGSFYQSHFKSNVMGKYMLLLCIISIKLLSCGPDRGGLGNDSAKLNAELNNTAETIHVGDTLKFKLTIPDTLITSLQKILVNSLQETFYTFTFYRVDTITKIGTRMTGNTFFVTEGTTDGAAVYVSKNNKPFTATLNIIPPTKGLYYVQVTPQPGIIRVNNSFVGGLRVNFDVVDKHWIMYNNYIPGFYPAVTQFDNDGYGYYCFKVN